jgi:N-acyl-D-aspartate/D-glutamate deacylase
MHDMVIRRGTVVDGTGSPRFEADVAVDGGVITEVGEVAGRGRREIDAHDLLVAPGWVDVHTHYDGQVTWDPLLAPSSWHGVTTLTLTESISRSPASVAPLAPETARAQSDTLASRSSRAGRTPPVRGRRPSATRVGGAACARRTRSAQTLRC